MTKKRGVPGDDEYDALPDDELEDFGDEEDEGDDVFGDDELEEDDEFGDDDEEFDEEFDEEQGFAEDDDFANLEGGDDEE